MNGFTVTDNQRIISGVIIWEKQVPLESDLSYSYTVISCHNNPFLPRSNFWNSSKKININISLTASLDFKKYMYQAEEHGKFQDTVYFFHSKLHGTSMIQADP